MKKVKISGMGDCWEWQSTKTSDGYGRMRAFGKGGYLAHRLAYILFIEQFPENLEVCHKCDNPSCVNPNHLFLGTHSDNMIDMTYKGRQRSGTGNSKITPNQVRQIREMYKTGKYTQIKLGQMFNICAGSVKAIVNRYTWADI